MKCTNMKMPSELNGQQYIKRCAKRYLATGCQAEADKKLEDVFKEVRKQGHMLPCELVEMGKWKAGGRILHLLRENCPEKLKQVTSAVLAGGGDCDQRHLDRERMRRLRELRGADFPMASVFLHFGGFDPGYPVLDVRAVRTLDGPKNIYSYCCWLAYTKFCRRAANNYSGVSMRTLDRALWQFDKEKNGGKKPPGKTR